MGDNSTVFVNQDGQPVGAGRNIQGENTNADDFNKLKVECIPFMAAEAPADAEGDEAGKVDLLPEYVSITKLLDQLCAALPTTQIRVFKVPILAGNRGGAIL